MINRDHRLRNLLIYGVGSIANSALGFILLPIYMKKFEPREFGIINIFLLVISFSSMFVSAGMMSSMQRQYFAVSEEHRKRLAGTIILWYVAIVTILAAIILPLRRYLSALLFSTDQYKDLFLHILLILAVSLIVDVPFNILRLEKRAAAYVSFSMFRLLTELGLKIVFIVLLHCGIRGYFVSSILSLLATAACLLLYTRANTSFSFSLEDLKALLRLGLPFIVTGFAIWSLNAVDRLQINFQVGPSATGIYSAGLRFSQIFTIVFYKPISLLLPPLMLSDLMEEDKGWQKFPKLFSLLAVGGGMFAMLASLLSTEGITLLTRYFGTHIEYQQATRVITALTFAHLTYAMAIPAGYIGLRLAKTSLFALAGLLAAVLNVLLNYLLIKLFGFEGAAWATLVSNVVYAAVCYMTLARLKTLPFNFVRHSLLLFLALSMTLGLQYIKLPLPIVVKPLMSVLIFFAIAWKVLGILNPESFRTLRRIAILR